MYKVHRYDIMENEYSLLLWLYRNGRLDLSMLVGQKNGICDLDIVSDMINRGLVNISTTNLSNELYATVEGKEHFRTLQAYRDL